MEAGDRYVPGVILGDKSTHQSTTTGITCGATVRIAIAIIISCLQVVVLVIWGVICLGTENYKYCGNKGLAIAMIPIGLLGCAPMIYGMYTLRK